MVYTKMLDAEAFFACDASLPELSEKLDAWNQGTAILLVGPHYQFRIRLLPVAKIQPT
jgi:hypothetical protein